MTNRKIAFRAWDKKNGKMMTSQLMLLPDGGLYITLGRMDIEEEDLVLMQNTGLTDKNGKEIYEGDILGYPNKGIAKVKDMFGTHYKWFAPVVWNVDRWTLKGQEQRSQKEVGYNQYWQPLMLDETAERMEVIGNIYENPELLSV